MPCVRPSRVTRKSLTAFCAALLAVAGDAARATELLFADVVVNGEPQGVTLVARDQDAVLRVTAETLHEWRMPIPDSEPVEIRGELYFSLSDLPGVSENLNVSTMRLELDVPPALLDDTRYSLADGSTARLVRDEPGAFLDYDLSYTRDSSPDERRLAGLFRPTVFTRQGNLSTAWLYNSQGYAFGVADRGWRRLETTWSQDDPDRMRSIRVGDAVTDGLSWSRSIRFGGFQIGSNFATRPDQVTFPQPGIEGTAAVPSTLDIYVNGLMRSQVEVPSGAFQINDIPVVTGAGQIEIVARDLLGREQIISKDFYASERMLRSGLNEWSLSIGRLRKDFAFESNHYEDELVSAVWRKGLSDRTTFGTQIQTTGSVRVFGSSLARSFSRYGLMSVSLARSSANGKGSLWSVGHQYQGSRFRADIRLLGTTAAFMQPGVEFANAFPQRQISLSGGVGLRHHGSLGLSFIRERQFNSAGRRISSMSYSRSLPAGFILSVAVSRFSAERRFTEFGLTLTRSLGPRASTSMSTTRRADGSRSRVDHRYELPTGPGYGYRTSIERGTQSITDAELLINTAWSRYGLEFSRVENSRALRLQTRGSVSRFGGAWFAAREISDGFAIVDAGGFEDVRVYLENRPVGATRSDGRLLVPNLRPYERNRLRLETADIPLAAHVETSTLTISPFYRSGTIASFGVRSTVSVVLNAVFADGVPVPEGSRARIDDGDFSLPVGLDGRLYVEGIRVGSVIEILVMGQICTIELTDGVPVIGMADIGMQVCAVEDSTGQSVPDR